LQSIDIPTTDINKLISFSEFLGQAHTKSHNEQFINIFSYIVRESGFLNFLMSLKNNAQALSSLDTLFNEIKREAFSKDSYMLSDFISYITVMKDVADTADIERNSKLPVLTMLQEPQDISLSLIDPEYITKRFTSRGLSVSALNNFIDSPVLYFFRNLVLLPEAMSDVLEFGNCIHKVLEDFFKDSMQTKSCGSKQDLLDTYFSVIKETARWSKYEVQAVP